MPPGHRYTRRMVTPSGSESLAHATAASDEADAAVVLFEDRFDVDLPPGAVVGSQATSGTPRLGRDREGALSVDHGALRIRFLLDPGWDRAALAYGPFPNEPGLAFAVRVTNGLATSQTWNDEPLSQKDRLKRAVQRWRRTFPRVDWTAADLHESLAVGWFAEPASTRRHQRPHGAAAVAWSTPDTEIGKLKVVGADGDRRVLEDVQNTPLLFIAVVRGSDVVLYASSIPDTRAFAPHPEMRPLGIVAAPRAAQLYAGVHQAVLGEVHYRLDTRVAAAKGVRLPGVSWHLGALVADRFSGTGPLAGPAERGGTWTVQGSPQRSAEGLVAEGAASAAVEVGDPAGLLRLDGAIGDSGELALRWRGRGQAGCELRVTPGGVALVVVDAAGGERVVAHDPGPVPTDAEQCLQVVDDGETVTATLGARLLFDGVRDLPSAGTEAGVAIRAARATRFEVHPRTVAVPPSLDLGMPRPVTGDPQPVVADAFTGDAGDLAGRRTPIGGRSWRRVLGEGVMETTGDGQARVRGTREAPAPGRTIYVVDWDDPEFADVAVTVIPPGDARGQRHQGRSGLALWQDAGNHLAINHFIDDTSLGVSISAFYTVDGHEAMHDNDATWSNVAERIRFGVPFRLRLSSDGDAFTVWVDDEAVLHRRYSDYRATAHRLRITGVGLLTNWEWGDDTGSRFRDFRASGRGG